MSKIQSSAEHLTLNADGSSKDIKFQANGVEKASISSSGAFTSTTIDATKLTGNLPAISGAALTGISSVGGATGVDFNDNVKARFGTGNDLEIYHDASHSYIKDAGTGNLHILTNHLSVNNAANTEAIIHATEDAGVSLYYNNSKKIETHDNGVLLGNNREIRFSDTSGNARTSVWYDSSNNLNFGQSGGMVKIRGGGAWQTVVEIPSSYKGLMQYGTADQWMTQMFAGGTGVEYFFDFRLSNNSQVGYIHTNGSSTSYNTSSDYRLKENVDYTWDATTRLKQLKPARFNFIADDTNTLVDGFIAHEVQDIVPEAITGEKDAMEAAVLYTEEDDIPVGKKVGDVKFAEQIKAQSIDQSKLVPLLVKTIQELEARITALEA